VEGECDYPADTHACSARHTVSRLGAAPFLFPIHNSTVRDAHAHLSGAKGDFCGFARLARFGDYP